MSLAGSSHLTDEQAAAALTGAAGSDVVSHLAECTRCREEIDSIARGLQALRQEAREASEKPEGFWIRQRLTAAEAPPRRPLSPRLAWAAGLALVAGLGGLYLMREPAAVRVGAAADPDHELLRDVERAIRRDLPRALEPAALIASDLDRAAQASGDAER